MRAFLAALGHWLAGLIRALNTAPARRRTAATGAVMALAGVSVYIGQPTVPGEVVVEAPPARGVGDVPAPGVQGDASTANLWVSNDANGDSCTWSSTPVAYNSATDCATLDAAEAASAGQGGGTVLVTCASGGSCTFSSQTVTGTTGATDNTDVLFKPGVAQTVTFSGTNELANVDDVILEGFRFTGDDALVLDETLRVTIRKNDFDGPGNTVSNAAITLSNAGLGSDGDAAGADDTVIEDNWIDRNGGGVGVDMISNSVGDLTIVGNYITEPHEDHIHLGVNQSGATDPIQVINNVLTDAAPCCNSHSDAIQILKEPNADIIGNVFDQTQHGVVVTNGTGNGPQVDIESNYFDTNGSGTSINGGSPCEAGPLLNNTFRGPHAVGGYDLACSSASLRNGNVFMDTAPWAGSEDYNTFLDSSGWTLGSNSVAGQTAAAVFSNTGSTAVSNVYPPRVIAQWGSRLTGRTILDPRLKSDSPALGRSHPSSVPSTDLLGCSRGGDPDGGAYEFGGC